MNWSYLEAARTFSTINLATNLVPSSPSLRNRRCLSVNNVENSLRKNEISKNNRFASTILGGGFTNEKKLNDNIIDVIDYDDLDWNDYHHEIKENSLSEPDYCDTINSISSGKMLLAKKSSLKNSTIIAENDITVHVRQTGIKLGRNQLKNLLVLSCSFSLLYLAFFSLRNLQSSLYKVGIYSLAAMYLSNIFGCFLATPILSYIGSKWSIFIGMLTIFIYMGSLFLPSLLIPANAILGFNLSFMWIAQGTYLTTIAFEYSKATSQAPQTVIGIFNGTFLFLLHLSQIGGNLISSLVLNTSNKQNDLKNNYNNYFDNYTSDRYINNFTTIVIGKLNDMNVVENVQISEICGVSFCYDTKNPSVTTNKLQFKSFVILMTIFGSICLLAVLLLAIFLDKKKETDAHHEAAVEEKATFYRQLISILKFHKDYRLILLIPLLIYIGIQEALIFGEFTKAFLSCTLGVHRIGFVMAIFGASDAISSLICGKLQKCIPINGFIASAICINAVTITAMMYWKPINNFIPVSIFAVALGLGDAVWQTQIFSLCGLLFNNNIDQAFVSLRLYEASGVTIACFLGPILCMQIKFYIMLLILFIGGIFFVIMNAIQHFRKVQCQVIEIAVSIPNEKPFINNY